MDLREGIKSHFDDLGFEVTDPVLDKCIEICVLHNIDEETLADTWAAFSVTNLGGEAPTVETLAQMERKEFQNQDKSASSIKPNSHQPTTPLTIYNKTPTSANRLMSTGDFLNEPDTTPKGKSKESLLAKQLYTPTSRSTFSPASFSPISANPTENYTGRVNAGDVVCEFVERPAGDWKAKERVALTIAPYKDEVLHSRCKVMMEPLSEKAAVLNDIVERISSHIVELNGLQEPLHNRLVSQTEIVCVGRVVCDSNDHLNASSVLLEGSRLRCLGAAVPLDLSRLPSYALFPGQVVAVQAINPSGDKLVVNKLFSSAALPSPLSLPRFLGTMQVVVAAGPFTQAGSLLYEPLEDLMRYVKTHQPHVLIIIGPLVDLRQGQLTEGSLAESYDTLYNKIVRGVMDQLQGGWTQVVVVSSVNDASCLPIYPTPPPLSQGSSPSLHLVSDPSLLSINGLVIALTATDTLMHLGKEEISFPLGAGDRLGRLASHLIQQQSLYPVYPPVEGFNVDCDLWDTHASLPVTPHILVTPSNFRYFVKHIHNCLVVNPEHLSKGTGGGTFARLEIEPATEDTWSPATHVTAQIVRI